VSSFSDLIGSARVELPRATFARWAVVLFTLSVLTYLISLAASQAFLAAAGVCYGVHLLRDRPAVHFPPVKLPLALFCLGTILSVLWAANPAVGWFAVRKLVLFAILLLAANLVVSQKHLGFLYRGLFLESALAGLVGIVQFVIQYRSVRALHPGRIYFYMTLERISGFMGHWMNFGGQQMLVFAALLAFLLLSRRASKFWWGVMAIAATSIVLNLTRGVWLGCLVITLYVVARWRPRWLWALPVLMLAGYLAAPRMVHERVMLAFHPSTDPALSIRLEMWRAGWRMMQQHPWLGVGPNNIEEVYPLYLPPGKSPERGYHAHLHNNFFQFGAERGLPVLAAWVWFMAALGWHFWRIRRRLAHGKSQGWIADAAIAAWLALLVEGCFEFNFGTSPVLMLFLFVATTPFVAERLALLEGNDPTDRGEASRIKNPEDP
jgi:O-antigen ligase